MKEINGITWQIIACAISVHKVLGPGLLESVYEEYLAFELSQAGLKVARQVPVPVIFKEIKLNCGFRIDILIDDNVILELKSVDTILPVNEAQLLTYMKLAKKRIGLLINFNEILLKDGIKRYLL